MNMGGLWGNVSRLHKKGDDVIGCGLFVLAPDAKRAPSDKLYEQNT